MTPYGPVSLALLHDLRVRPLSWAERGVLHHLSLVASVSPDGATVHIVRRTGEAEVAAWASALGVEGAAIVGRLVEVGLLVSCPEGLRIVLLAKGAPSPASPSASPNPSRVTASAWQGKPSESPVAQRARNDRALFKARSKGAWARTPEGLTWEQWITTDEGQRFVAAREADFAGYREWVTPHDPSGNAPRVTPQGNAVPGTGNAPRVTPQGNAPHYVSQNPSSPEEEKKEEQERVTGNAPRVTPQGNAPRVTPSPGNTLDALRAAAAGRATLSGAAALEVECAAVLARHGLTDEEMQRAGEAFGDPSAWWPKGKNPAPAHVTLNDLAGFRGDAGFEWRSLAALVAHVRAPRRAPPVRARVAAPAPPPPPSATATAADVRRVVQRHASAPAPAASKETVDA